MGWYPSTVLCCFQDICFWADSYSFKRTEVSSQGLNICTSMIQNAQLSNNNNLPQLRVVVVLKNQESSESAVWSPAHSLCLTDTQCAWAKIPPTFFSTGLALLFQRLSNYKPCTISLSELSLEEEIPLRV